MFCKVVTVLVLLAVSNVFGAPNSSPDILSAAVAPRIIGGGTTTIYSYPYMTSLIQSTGAAYSQYCAGSILTTTVILTAAQCIVDKNLYQCQARVGSSYANSGGVTHQLRQAIIHPSYNRQTLDCDVALLKTTIAINFIPNTVAAGTIAAPSYNLRDNQPVWAIGWGYVSLNGPASEVLRHVQIWSVNQSECRSRYAEIGIGLTDNMLCSGWLDVGGRDQCIGDSGGPLLHNNVIVGVCSWGSQCALARYPGVNTRVSRFTSWIISAAA